jgi:hypothetical protein
MELSPEEQSFFDAGDALDPPSPSAEEPQESHRHRSRRRSRRSMSHRLRRSLRRSGWRKTTVSVVVTIFAIYAGYQASMYVANRDLPSGAELGVEARAH